MRASRLARAVSLAAVLALAACTGDRPTEPAGSRTTSSATTTATASPTAKGMTVVGAPAGLASLVRALYAAREGKATATLGRWHGSQVAVVTSGQDVTLAVGSPRWTVVGGWWPSLGKPTPRVGGKRFVLALGSDARVTKGQTLARSRADALQLVGMDGRGGGGVLGLARDLWVPLSSGGRGKINSAMVFGGPQAQVATVSKATGLPVQGYLLMGFQGVTGFIDTMGGLPVVLDRPISSATLPIHLAAGPHRLTGAQVLAYARERKTLPDGDFGRSRHQSLVLLAGAVEARLRGVGAVPAALTALDSRSESNLTAAQMLTFAAGFYVLSPTKVGHRVAKGSNGIGPDGQSIVVLDRASGAAFRDFRDGRL